jgi:outer membrane protein OmpA-like peptidoglycan-associated protein
MTQHKKAEEAKPDQKKRRQVERTAIGDQTDDLARGTCIGDYPLAASGAGSVCGQIAGISNRQLQSAQRFALVTHIGQLHGNQHLQRIVASVGLTSSTAPYQPKNSGERRSGNKVATRSTNLQRLAVPGLPARWVRQAEANLTGDPQAAVNAVVQGLVGRGQVNTAYLDGGRVTYVSDRSRMPRGHYGHTSLTPGSGHPRPCRVVVGPDALRSVGLLYTTIMHEYQHVLQFRQNRGGAGESVDEVEARLWEIEHLQDSGLWRDVQYMAVLPGQLQHWWNQLTTTQQAPLRARHRRALATIQEMNRRRLEEQFRQQTGRGSPAARTIQREDAGSPDAGTTRGPRDAGPAAGVPAPARGPTPSEPQLARPTFTAGRFESYAPRFDAVYTPVGPVPSEGTFEVILKVHIAYRDFSRALMRRERRYRRHRFTREQLRDFAWSESEKRTFASGFQTSVQTAWGGKHILHLNDPTFSEYRARVQVRVDIVRDRNQAHTKITAQKIPRGAPRFRSFVRGDEAVLDIRDVTEPTTSTDASVHYVRQVGPFGFDSAELTSEIEGQLRSIESDLRPLQSPTDRSRLLGGDWYVDFTGRASARGSRAYNERLGLRRAQAVEQRMYTDMGYPRVTQPRSTSRGEEHASRDERFQRVDIKVWSFRRAFEEPSRSITQNVAAHEAGHMFGLGDEYVEEEPPRDVEPKFMGDRPSHYGDVQALMGTEAANDLLVQDSGSIMSQGGEVRRGHYVYFLQRINQLTGRRWTVE